VPTRRYRRGGEGVTITFFVPNGTKRVAVLFRKLIIRTNLRRVVMSLAFRNDVPWCRRFYASRNVVHVAVVVVAFGFDFDFGVENLVVVAFVVSIVLLHTGILSVLVN